MATGAGWQHYYNPAGSASTGKYNSTSTSTSTSTSFPSGLTLEYTQDLHLKMSKKIAQLTKVIFCAFWGCVMPCVLLERCALEVPETPIQMTTGWPSVRINPRMHNVVKITRLSGKFY
ncbi:hypothetical protein QQF64_016236 [Cirrhinus molitorella]|uniref:Uncharacterized protein n=1 Tax=Cirrhinus molitorella TaxID=172907 RepID=A0ABR3LQX5_9TELE